ncbi:citrulline utilization hydrolase CtlX [Thalassomonas actiniarum]|uniref:Amidinotransferase n=1 Tax=Thalassomonas actiniarum TaxID=485447 RepID=A0AAE9YR31_9GAMM|nr:arginine deiminase-related protein [Thalassomonas actiniarum]WDD99694.1 amidinotransferase [Thalassomonas actiniarum]
MKNYHQAPAAVVMIRPHHFCPNPQTAADNAFQKRHQAPVDGDIKSKALAQVDTAAEILARHGVKVILFDDETRTTPDSVFPNNWFSTHENGAVGIYPMYCENRRRERREDILAQLGREYRVRQTFDYARFESQGLFLEGTGAMVLDHINRIAYAVKSKRMSDWLLNHFCRDFNYQAVAFHASDENNVDVYHTNVLMCIGTGFVMIGSELIKDGGERRRVMQNLQLGGREVIELTLAQIRQFAGNALELATAQGNILAISQTAFNSLNPEQISRIEKYVRIVPLDVSTIELAGGSIRCMLAGIHLPRKSESLAG